MVEDLKKGLTKRVSITNELGLHARAAARIAEVAQKANAKVWIVKNGDRADASSIIDILTLACPKDTGITIMIDDQKDIDVLDSIEELFEEGFGE